MCQAPDAPLPPLAAAHAVLNITQHSMQPLAIEPTAAEFTPVKEYKSSTPKTFALNETPILFFSGPVACQGALGGQARLWVSSAGLSVWFDTTGTGSFISQAEIVLHALDSAKVYVQGSSFELWLEPVAEPATTLYNSIFECLEIQEYMSSDDEEEGDLLEGDSIDDDRFLDLESGQGDDDSWGAPSRSRSRSSAQVFFQNSLGKRTRE